jgi:hypothetical protein
LNVLREGFAVGLRPTSGSLPSVAGSTASRPPG